MAFPFLEIFYEPLAPLAAHDRALLRPRKRLALARDEDELLEDAAVGRSASVCFLDEGPESGDGSVKMFMRD